MKVLYIAILTALLVLAGCSSAPDTDDGSMEEPAMDDTAVDTGDAEATEPTVVEGAGDIPPNREGDELTEEDLAAIERYKDACGKGNAGLCAALERQFGIVMEPGQPDSAMKSDDSMEE